MTITTLTPTTPWHGRDGELIFAFTSGVEIVTTKSLYDSFAQAELAHGVQATAKNITITPPETAYEKQDLTGVDSNGFQNAFLDEKPVGTAMATATLILDRDEVLEPYVESTPTVITGGYSRYQIGDTVSPSPPIAVCVLLSGADAQAQFCLSGAHVTKWGDLRISAPDAHWEQDVTVTCLPKDFMWDVKD